MLNNLGITYPNGLVNLSRAQNYVKYVYTIKTSLSVALIIWNYHSGNNSYLFSLYEIQASIRKISYNYKQLQFKK